MSWAFTKMDRIPFYLTGKDFYFIFGILLAKKEKKVTLNSNPTFLP